ncbi:MAG: elongation factor Ts [Magnetovibrio sp.]|nr:elongation factor Ts [Magnetovibrio sp.]
MPEITADLVKRLREKTGAGMMDCKKALTKNSGDIENAVDWLRTKGLAAAAKKAARAASEGLIGLVVKNNSGAMVEINTETDFVGRNESFQNVVSNVTSVALASGDNIETIKNSAYPETGRTVDDEIAHQIATIGENMLLRRAKTLAVNNGVLASYLHGAVVPGLGKIGVLVALESDGDIEKLQELGKQLAMHIAASKPIASARDDLDENIIERERSIFYEQARESGKPSEIIDKMVEGRLRKYFEEVCLLEQTFVIDGESKVSQILENAENDLKTSITLTGFKLLVLGEGIEKKEEDFAAEVAAAANS